MSEARRIRGGRTRAHFRGCLVGGAVGDALGAAVEFKTWDEIRSEFGPAGLRDYSMCYRRIGAITDDTQMTLFTAEALLRAEHLRHRAPAGKVAEVAWHAYLRWLETQGDVVQRRGIPDEEGWLVRMKDLHARRGPGNTCLSALRKGRMGTPEIPINDGKGCGGVMRVAPVGFAPGHPFRTGCELAAITHGHPTGWLAAGYLAQLVHDVAEGATLDEGAVRALEVLRRHPGHEETSAAVEKALWMSRAPRGTTADVESLGG
ncbi:MAG TPA: ADP-ribosylglycohydrolase family protein, partial [Anaeromyxobacteraceae bacterium]|nr:ADP-ribosylglycohydrolase family protein [Anaeromyxobacteraceae bacterium]